MTAAKELLFGVFASTGVAIDRPFFLHSLQPAILAPGLYTVIFVDGVSTAGRWMMYFRPSLSNLEPVVFSKPVYFSRGLYIANSSAANCKLNLVYSYAE